MNGLQYVRTLRTASSERYLLQVEGKDAGAVDLHFLPSGTVAGTVVLLDGGPISDDEVQGLLSHIDETLLPDAAISQDNLFFTVVRGHVVGSYQPSA